MTFTLTIEIAEDVTRRDIALALRRAANGIERYDTGPFEEGDAGSIRAKGDLVGNWEVTPSDEL